MAEKNRQIAEAVVKAVGGTANITSVTHCMTRLRFVLKDKSIPNKKEVEKIPGVMGVNIAGGTVSGDHWKLRGKCLQGSSSCNRYF